MATQISGRGHIGYHALNLDADVVVASQQLAALADTFRDMLFVLRKTCFLSRLPLQQLRLMPRAPAHSLRLQESPICLLLCHLSLQDAFSSRDDRWVFVAVEEATAGVSGWGGADIVAGGRVEEAAAAIAGIGCLWDGIAVGRGTEETAAAAGLDDCVLWRDDWAIVDFGGVAVKETHFDGCEECV